MFAENGRYIDELINNLVATVTNEQIMCWMERKYGHVDKGNITCGHHEE